MHKSPCFILYPIAGPLLQIELLWECSPTGAIPTLHVMSDQLWNKDQQERVGKMENAMVKNVKRGNQQLTATKCPCRSELTMVCKEADNVFSIRKKWCKLFFTQPSDWKAEHYYLEYRKVVNEQFSSSRRRMQYCILLKLLCRISLKKSNGLNHFNRKNSYHLYRA